MGSRFRTVGRDAHRLGRISLRLAVDPTTKTLAVHVHSARELPERLKSAASFVRVQIHNKQQSDVVVSALFSSAIEPRKTKYAWRSDFHQSTQFPMYQAGASFSLKEIWAQLSEYRIYVALMAVVDGGVDYIGSLSFSFTEAPTLTNLAWYWLGSKARGLLANELVDHKEFPSDPFNNIVLSGRNAEAPNAFINGTYVRQQAMEGGRPVYREQTKGLFLYYHAGRGAWAIGEIIGSNSPYAYVDDRASSPDGILRTWQVFSVERAFRSKAKTAASPEGHFVADPQILCTAAQQKPSTQESPERAKPTRVTREMKINELVSSMTVFLDHLRILDGYYNELESSLSPEEHQQLFANFTAVLAAAADWVRLLKARQISDAGWTQPVGALLLQGADLLSKPMVAFCVATQHHADLINQLVSLSPAFADDIQEVQAGMHTDVSLPTALGYVPEQAIINQQMVAFIANSTPVFHPDRDGVLEARNAFDSISAQSLAGQPKRPFQLSPSYNQRHSTALGSRDVRHSQFFDPRILGAIMSGSFADLGDLANGTGLMPSQSRLSVGPAAPNPAPAAAAAAPAPRRSSLRRDSGARQNHASFAVGPDLVQVADEEVPLRQSSQRSTGGASTASTWSQATGQQTGYSSLKSSYSQPAPVVSLPPVPQSAATQRPPWLFPALSKEQAERLLDADGSNDGRFLVRERVMHPGDYVLTLAYNGQPTHHLMTVVGGVFTVNRKSFGDPKTLEEAIECLRVPQQGWPQILSSYVKNTVQS